MDINKYGKTITKVLQFMISWNWPLLIVIPSSFMGYKLLNVSTFESKKNEG